MPYMLELSLSTFHSFHQLYAEVTLGIDGLAIVMVRHTVMVAVVVAEIIHLMIDIPHHHEDGQGHL